MSRTPWPCFEMAWARIARRAAHAASRLVIVAVGTLAAGGLVGPAAAQSPAPSVAAPESTAASGARLALVIGNNAYAVGPLLNPVNDARAMASTLEAVGFQVLLRTDANLREMIGAVREFGERLRAAGSGAVGIFYYAGHGFQIKGRNFLIPVGADITHEDEVAYQSLEAQAVLDKMESAGNGTNLLILDSCRDNPFARSMRSATRGLAQMDAPVGTLVAFSTAPGSVASDGRGSNGLYTSHLLAAIKRPGLKVEDVFKVVRNGVLRDSNNRQQPWESTALTGDFFFVPPVEAAAAVAAAQAALDDALWETVKDAASAVEVSLYLRRFPAGRHAAAARGRLQAMGVDTGPTTAALAPAVAPATPVVAPTPAPAAIERPPVAAVRPAAARPAPMDDREITEMLRREAEERERAHGETEAETMRRLTEITRWGDEDTARRPTQPRRSEGGLAEGDRWRYAVRDLMRDEFVGQFLWRIDRIEPDGGLWIGDGAVQADGRGQLRVVNEARTGSWATWSPGVPAAEVAAGGTRARRDIETRYQSRTADGIMTRADFSGSVRVGASERVTTEAGNFDAVRIDVDLRGRAERSNGTRPYLVWRHTYWYAPKVGMPVAMQFDERADGQIERRIRHELTAADVLEVGRVLARGLAP
ncbi:MAG: caspase domain-containing protein [Betaproteobacteria bacterium]